MMERQEYKLYLAVESPLRTIVENAGLEGSVVVAKVAEGKGDFGYNAKLMSM
jgi:chaperonin GroEL